MTPTPTPTPPPPTRYDHAPDVVGVVIDTGTEFSQFLHFFTRVMAGCGWLLSKRDFAFNGKSYTECMSTLWKHIEILEGRPHTRQAGIEGSILAFPVYITLTETRSTPEAGVVFKTPLEWIRVPGQPHFTTKDILLSTPSDIQMLCAHHKDVAEAMLWQEDWLATAFGLEYDMPLADNVFGLVTALAPKYLATDCDTGAVSLPTTMLNESGETSGYYDNVITVAELLKAVGITPEPISPELNTEIVALVASCSRANCSQKTYPNVNRGRQQLSQIEAERASNSVK